MSDQTKTFKVRLGDAGTWIRWIIVLVVPAIIGTAALAGKAVIQQEVDSAIKIKSGNAEKKTNDIEAKVDKVEESVDAAAREQKADLQRHEDKMDAKIDRIQDQLDDIIREMRRNARRPR